MSDKNVQVQFDHFDFVTPHAAPITAPPITPTPVKDDILPTE